MPELNFTPPGEVARQFMLSEAFVRGIRGPFGSGKTVTCCVEIFRRACQQTPGVDGVRRTRWAVIRRTGPQLKNTTIKTWLDWFPEHEWGTFRWSPPFNHMIRFGDVEMEVLFLALDSEQDIDNLLSLELTGAFISEAREIDKGVLDAVTGRVGRYPSMREGGPSWYGVIMDTNSMDPDHWWPIMAGEAPPPDDMSEEEALMYVRPDNWQFFTQPAAMLEQKDDQGKIVGYVNNPKAENSRNLTPDYYTNQIRGKNLDYIGCYILNRLTSVKEGRLVYVSYDDSVHCTSENIQAVPGIELLIGLDFGLTPSASINQRVHGQWRLLDELLADDMGAERFGRALKQFLAERYSGMSYQIWGDPAGDQRAQSNETTPFQILRAQGIQAIPAPTNDFLLRTGAVDSLLTRMVDGKPGFQISPKARVHRGGFQRGYFYPPIARGSGRVSDRPLKNRFSHPHDALQYAAMGAGEGRALTNRGTQSKPGVMRRPSILARRFNSWWGCERWW